MQSAESPANSRLRPVPTPEPLYTTSNSASTYPSSGRKKNCTPFAACTSVKFCGSLGLFVDVPAAVDVNVWVAVSTATLEVIALPDEGVSGDT